MPVEIKCPHCRHKKKPPIFIEWIDYAHHIINEHPSDIPRYNWAKRAIADIETTVENPPESDHTIPDKVKEQMEAIALREKIIDETEALVKAHPEVAERLIYQGPDEEVGEEDLF